MFSTISRSLPRRLKPPRLSLHRITSNHLPPIRTITTRSHPNILRSLPPQHKRSLPAAFPPRNTTARSFTNYPSSDNIKHSQQLFDTLNTHNLPPPYLHPHPPRKKKLFIPKTVKRTIKAALLALLLIVVTPELQTTGNRRSAYFWSHVLPIYFHYQAIIFKWRLHALAAASIEEHDNGGSGLGHIFPNLESTPEETPRLTGNFNIDSVFTEEVSPISTDSTPNSLYTTREPPHTSQSRQILQHPFDLPSPIISPTEALPPGLSPAQRDFFSRVHSAQKAVSTKVESVFDKIRSSDQGVELQDTLNTLAAENYALEALQTHIPILFKQTLQFTALLPSLHQVLYHFKSLGSLILHTGKETFYDPLPGDIKDFMGTTSEQFHLVSTSAIRTGLTPMISHYRDLIELDPAIRKTLRQADLDRLHAKYAQQVYDLICEMKSYYIKLAQIGSLRNDIFPEAWLVKLREFQNNCPHLPLYELVPLIESEIGPLADSFEYIVPKPLGAASIGQVHRAKLKDGPVCVIKIQYPDVERTFKADMATMRVFCALVQKEMLPLLTEIEKAFVSEFNFKQESVNLLYASHDLAGSEFANIARIPRPVPHLCVGDHVLVMEFLPGKKLSDQLFEDFTALAKSQGMTLKEFAEAHKDDAPPSPLKMSLIQTYLNTTHWVSNSVKMVYNYSYGWLTGQQWEYNEPPPLIDISDLVSKLFAVHGFQIFHGHMFSSDPHAGNMLKDKAHDMINSIDYGQTKSLTLYQRAVFAQLISAFARGDVERACMVYLFAGHRTRHNYLSTVETLATIAFNYDNITIRRGMRIEQLMEKLHFTDPVKQAAKYFILPGRCGLLLRGLAHMLHMDTHTADFWAPFADDFLNTHPVLKEVTDKALDEFTEIYFEELAHAKEQAMKDFGSDEAYTVNLDRCIPVERYAETIGALYDTEMYDKMFLPLPPRIWPEADEIYAKLDQRLADMPELKRYARSLNVIDFLPTEVPTTQDKSNTTARALSKAQQKRLFMDKPKYIQKFEQRRDFLLSSQQEQQFDM